MIEKTFKCLLTFLFIDEKTEIFDFFRGWRRLKYHWRFFRVQIVNSEWKEGKRRQSSRERKTWLIEFIVIWNSREDKNFSAIQSKKNARESEKFVWRKGNETWCFVENSLEVRNGKVVSEKRFSIRWTFKVKTVESSIWVSKVLILSRVLGKNFWALVQKLTLRSVNCSRKLFKYICTVFFSAFMKF